MRVSSALPVCVALLCALLVGGCRRRASEATPANSGRGVSLPTPGAPAMPAQPGAPAPRWQDPMLPHSEARPGMVRVEAAPPATESETVPGAPIFVPPPRDYAGELRASVGEIAGCVGAGEIAALPERVEVDLEAVVTGSGVVARGDVRSAALPESALRCLRARLDAVRFTSPVPDAPQRITAHVVLDRRPAVAAPR